jgi:hypothetical protein
VIKRGAQLTVARVPICQMRITEYQKRYPDRLTHYLGLLEQNATDDLGVIYLKPFDSGGYEVLDGHHRYVAYVMSGRPDALALIIDESECEEN